MAWSAPRTWVTGELVTSTLLNTHLRDNFNYLYAPIALVTRTNQQTGIGGGSPGAWTKATFETTVRNDEAMFDGTNHRMVAKQAGAFEATFNANGIGSGNATYGVGLRKNLTSGAGESMGHTATSVPGRASATEVFSMIVNDYVEAWIWNGEAVSVGASPYSFSMRRISG